MSRILVRIASAGAALAVGLILAAPNVTGQSGQPSTAKGEWPYYTADLKGSRYSPLDQINASNFSKLEVAWRFKTDNFGPFPEFKLEGTPLMVNGVLYTTAGTRRAVVALDARTGEQIWTHSLREGKRAAVSPRQLSGRGVGYWTDGKGDERILYVTTGYRLVELNAKNGSVIESFGTKGVVDLKAGVVKGRLQQIDLETGEIGIHSTPIVVRDVAIIGSAMREGATVETHDNTKGLVRAFDVRTGKMIWQFDTIPRPGQFGSDTWLKESWASNGNVGVWTQITVDEELGLVYLPVETPSSDYYGGHRPGNNLFAESLVCVDLKTGQRKWHFQFVHHPIWNFDMSSAPLLGDVTVDGKPRKVVAVPSKQSWLYVFDRVTGEPIWPIEEKPVPAGTVPGEWYSPTQPHPPDSLRYARNMLTMDDVIDFTPQLRAEALERLKSYKWEAIGVRAADPRQRQRMSSARSLPARQPTGPAADTIPSCTSHSRRRATRRARDRSSRRRRILRHHVCVGRRRPAVPRSAWPRRLLRRRFTAHCRTRARGERAAAAAPPAAAPPANAAAAAQGLTVQGLPIVKPPYGLAAAIDLDRGKVLWQAPHGDTPDNIRNHPLLRGMNVPKTGQPGTSGVGLLVTKTLVIMGDPQITTTPTRPRGAMLRAYDKKTGQQVGEVWLPAQQSGSPMTYSVNGKQYIVVAVSGGAYSGEYLAFSLPEGSTTTSK